MRRTQTGFTLIELMIVVAIIGILSAVALVSYNEYISVSQVGIVRSNFDEAKRLVFNHYALNGQRVSLGINPSVPDDFNGWVALVNPDNLESPTSEGPAYIEGAANPLTGSVGLLASGSWATGDSQLVISQPAFGGLPAESITVRMQDL